VEDLIKKLRDYSRFLELEDSIPYWENQIPELKDRLEEMKWNQQQKEIELLNLKEPNFFQRTFGRAEEKKERISKQIREITAAKTSAQWELEGLEKQIKEGKEELAILADSRKNYEEAKGGAELSAGRESQLMMEEITAFAPVALETAWHVLVALEEARPWMSRDVRTSRVGSDNRKMECLSKAEAAAARLVEILTVMPEGVATIGSYLREPHGYIYGVTSEFKQLDRLELAQEQVRTVRTQLKLLLGE
jgi:uncharacterized protein YPO0396